MVTENLLLNIINSISGRYAKKIEQLMSPLKAKGISYFFWQSISNEGNWNFLGNRPDWLEHCAGNQFYMNDPSLIHPQFYQSGINYTSTYSEEQFQNTFIKDAVTLFSLNHGLAIVERTMQGTEFAIFAAPNENTQMINVYMNRIPWLKQFVKYFKKVMSQSICAMSEVNLDIAKIKQEAFYLGEQSLIFPEKFDAKPQASLDLLSFDVKATKREQECLHYTLQGMTAKEIARKLNISHRTVEIHLDNIRNKFKLSSKRAFHTLLVN